MSIDLGPTLWWATASGHAGADPVCAPLPHRREAAAIMRIARTLALIAAAVLMAGAVSAPAQGLATVVDPDPDEVLDAVEDLNPLGSEDGSSSQVHRAGGAERVATSVAASRQFRDAADTALLATAGDFPDALAATALAAEHDAPVLLTRQGELPGAVADELDRLGVERTVLLGGTDVISDRVASELTDQGYQVDRVAGAHRYGTARQIATAAGPPETGEVLLTLGAHDDPAQAWPDAVASGALAASPDALPTLLTAPGRLPGATRQALNELDAERAVLVGGESAIPPAIQSEVESMGLDTQRLAASSRYGTSVQVAREALERNAAESQPIVLATGENFPDALSAGALAATLNAPLVLTPSAELADVVDEFVRDHRDRWDGGVVVGGSAAASDMVIEQLEAALDGAPRPEAEEPAEGEDEDEADSGTGQTEGTDGGTDDTDDGTNGSDGQTEDEETDDNAQTDDGVVSTFEGEASWYGAAFHGQQTACGEPYNMHDLTAAHRDLPCGTRVRVTNTHNGRQVTVRINDYGPADHSRVIDLSRAAAGEIGMRSSGTAWVRGEVLAD